jgi:hypothetical protein
VGGAIVRSWAEHERTIAALHDGEDAELGPDHAEVAIALVLCSAGVDVPTALLDRPFAPSAVAVSAVALSVPGLPEGPWTAEIIAEHCGCGPDTIEHALRRAHRTGLLVVDVAGVSRRSFATSIVRVGPVLRPLLDGPRTRKGGT